MRVLLLADTHIGPARPNRRLPDGVYDFLLEGVDAILHAGDVTSPELLHELEAFAPVHAVLGNNDVDLRLPETVEVELDGVRVAMIHDSGPSSGRGPRLRRRFPDADVAVFGHSHLPWDETDDGGQRHLNPGSPTERRMAPTRTAGLLTVADSRVRDYQLVSFGEGGGQPS